MPQIQGPTDEYGWWTAQATELRPMNAAEARDIVVECLFEAQKTTFARTKGKLGIRTDDEAVRKSVTSLVRLSFEDTGGTFDRPTKEALGVAIAKLAELSRSWGTPRDIIEHHRAEIEKVLAQVV